MKTDVVEDEELGFRPEVNRVGDACELEIALGAFGQCARVEPVAFARDRVNYIGGDAERRALHELIDPEARGVGDQEHVALVDGRPAAQAAGIKAEACGERIFGQLVNRKRQVMPGSEQVCEAQVYELCLGVGSVFQNIFGIHYFLLVFGLNSMRTKKELMSHHALSFAIRLANFFFTRRADTLSIRVHSVSNRGRRSSTREMSDAFLMPSD